MFLTCGYGTGSHSLESCFPEEYPQTIDSTLAFSSSDSFSFDYASSVLNSDIELPTVPVEVPVLTDVPVLKEDPSTAVPNIALPTNWSGVSCIPPMAERREVYDTSNMTCKER